MKIQKWGAAAVAVAALSLVAGCTTGGGPSPTTGTSGTGTAAAPITLSFMGWGSPTEVSTYQAMIAQFEAKYPNVTVDYITSGATNDGFTTKLQTMFAAHQAPDVFYLQPESTMAYANDGWLWDMTDYVANNSVFDQSNVWAKALDMFRYDGTTPGVGAIYGLPKDIGPYALAYNVDMFKAAGIPLPDPKTPWTWDQYVTYAQKLTSGEGANKIYGSDTYSLESAVWSSGADWLNADHTQVTITDPKFTTAMQWVADLVLKYHVAPTPAEVTAEDQDTRFENGQLAMRGIGPWMQGPFWDNCKFNWDIMPWPVPQAGDTPATWYGSDGLAVSSQSAHPQEAANLAAFLAFNEDAQRTAMNAGQAIPNLVDMAQTEYLAMDKPPASKQVFLDIASDWGRRATQTYTYTSDWFNDFNTNAASVWEGSQTAVQFAAQEQPAMQSMLDAGIAESKQ